jgi:hypothetical protein
MHDRKNESNPSPLNDPLSGQSRSNAFAPTSSSTWPAGTFTRPPRRRTTRGRWRVVKLHGEGPVRFGCNALGERSPRLVFEAPGRTWPTWPPPRSTSRTDRTGSAGSGAPPIKVDPGST